MGKNPKKRKDPFADREAQKYEHPIPSRELILEYLGECESPVTYKQIAQDLNITSPEEHEGLRRRLIAMIRDGQLHQNRRGAYGPVEKMELICGRILGHKDGFGFFEPENGEEDLFLSPRQMRQVFPNDKVLVRVADEDYRGRKEAVIVDVLERNTHTLVGRFFNQSGVAYVEPSNPKISHDIAIPDKETGNANDGQMVIVEIIAQPTISARPTGRVISVLGDHMAPGMEIDVAIHNHEIPYIWPDNVTQEATYFSADVKDEEIIGREDLRSLSFVTIDGEDAKDFDDAVYCEPTNKGYELYVAIADVSYYVKTGTALDEEALNRGNSVYFPQRVIPMLPEILSNELCSLRPNINRLAIVCKMTITPAGKISKYDFSEAVIRSHARLTYNQVYDMYSKNNLAPHLKNLFDLFKILKNARELRGTIDFDLPETKIIFGAGRKIEQIIPSERNDAHRLIEECMLCANISASKFLLKNKCPALYRIHEGPSTEKLNDLKRFLKEIGLKLPGRSQPTPNDYSLLLESVAGRPDAHLIQTVLLRSLSQAIYHPENKGHFGLAFDAYTHFTSPIRRYPDLLVHRAIRSVLQKKFQPGEDPRFEKYGEHCSMTERRADEATREAISWLKCEFMMDKLGEEFQGVISGVTAFGFFVELSKIYVEGLVHISGLHNDYYHFDHVKHSLVGERTGKRYRLGDVVNIKVVRVDLDNRQIDLMLAENFEPEKNNDRVKSKKPKKQKRKKH